MPTNNPQPPAHIASTAIATEAYCQWIAAGQPAGRDQEFWLKAEAALKNNGKGTTRKSTAGGPKSAAKAARKR